MLERLRIQLGARGGRCGALTWHQVLCYQRVLLAARDEHALVPVRLDDHLGAALHAAAPATPAAPAPPAPPAAELGHAAAAAAAAIPAAAKPAAAPAAAAEAATAAASVTCHRTVAELLAALCVKPNHFL